MKSAIKFSTHIKYNVEIKMWFRAIANRRLVGPIIKPPIRNQSC